MIMLAKRFMQESKTFSSFDEIRGFSKELSDELGYEIKDFKEDSRVVLLGK